MPIARSLILPRVIGLVGPAGAGKTTAAAYLRIQYGYKLHPFAAPLKNMLRALGLNDAELTGHLKETPSPMLCGVTPRQAMQWLGTEWGRNLIDPNLWVSQWRRGALREKIVADDLRFPNEATAVHALGGIIIRLSRPTTTRHSAHASETAGSAIRADFTIQNTGDVPDMHAELDLIVRGRSDVETGREEKIEAGNASS